jgi:hypothetical protein
MRERKVIPMDHNNVSNDNTNLQEKIMKQIHELGDTLERAGQKIEKSGWETIGQAIYKLGDALEHLNEKSGKSFGSSKNKEMNASSTTTPSSNLNASNSFSSSNPSIGQHPAGASVTSGFSTSSDSTTKSKDTFANNDFTSTPKKSESDRNTSDRF